MAPVMVHAAAFDPDIAGIALVEPYSSYLSIVTSHFYSSSYIPGVVPGALKAYDLPDIEGSLAPRRLLIAGATGGNGKRTDEDAINADLGIVRKAYSGKKADNNHKPFFYLPESL